MAHHTVTLNYGNDGFRPTTDPLLVDNGDTISFQLGEAPPNSRFEITMHDPHFFSAAQVTDSNTRITVVKAADTSYRCQLFGSAGNLLSWAGQPGGHVKPGKSG
jgi:hypothetical protein